MTELLSSETAKLRWRCRRGMRELDVLLITFLTQSYESLPVEQKNIFSELLELPDPELHEHLLGKYECDPIMEKLLQRMRVFSTD